MWKYRNQGILSGWNGAVLLIALFAGLGAGFIITVMGYDPDITVTASVKAMPFVLSVLIVIAGYLLFRKHRHDDDEYRQKPVTPEWSRLRQDSPIIESMRRECKSWFIAWLLILTVAAALLAFSMLKDGFHDRTDWWIFAAAMTGMGLVHLRNGLRWYFWVHPPMELEYTAIDVAYCTEQHFRGKGGRRKDIKIYFFLPNGRYRVTLRSVGEYRRPPETIYFVRYCGVVRWIHWDDYDWND